MAVPQTKMASPKLPLVETYVFQAPNAAELGLKQAGLTPPQDIKGYLLFTYLCIWNDKCL